MYRKVKSPRSWAHSFQIEPLETGRICHPSLDDAQKCP